MLFTCLETSILYLPKLLTKSKMYVHTFDPYSCLHHLFWEVTKQTEAPLSLPPSLLFCCLSGIECVSIIHVFYLVSHWLVEQRIEHLQLGRQQQGHRQIMLSGTKVSLVVDGLSFSGTLLRGNNRHDLLTFPDIEHNIISILMQ